MPIRRSITLGALTLAVGSLAFTGSALAAGTTHAAAPAARSAHLVPGGLFRPAPGAQGAQVGGRSIVYSGNWSGYAVTGSTFKTATASWTQSAATCTSGDGQTDMSPWVGIDGYSSSTVEQTGSSADCSGAKVSYYAWYEMYPANVIVISRTVKPGDKFTGTVTHTSGTSYTLVLKDLTQGWTNSVTKSLKASDNSAEAVMEMAASHLTKFGTDPFTGFKVDGKAIGSFTGSPYKIERMELRVSGTVCDSTSSLTSLENFTTKWLNAC